MLRQLVHRLPDMTRNVAADVHDRVPTAGVRYDGSAHARRTAKNKNSHRPRQYLPGTSDNPRISRQCCARQAAHGMSSWQSLVHPEPAVNR